MTRRLLAIAFCVFAGAPLGAAPLPQFEVRDLQGASVSSSALARDGKWLLVYVTPDCAPCTELLALWNDPALDASRVTVIVGRASSDDAARAKAAAPQLASSLWLIDDQGAAAAALKTGGAPVAIAYAGSESQWTVKGMLQVTRGVIAHWLAPSAQ